MVFKCREDQPVVLHWSKIYEPEMPDVTTKDELPMTRCAAYGQGFNPGDGIEDPVYEELDV